MAKDGKTNRQPKTEDERELERKESPVEKALKLGNDEIIARAIQDMLKRDDKRLH